MVRFEMYFAVLAVSVLVPVIGCGKKSGPPVAQRVAVEVDSVTRRDVTVVRTYAGTLEGARQSKLFAVIPERVVSIPVSEGNYVEKGQPIIVLDKSGSSSQYNQAYAVYLNAKDNFEKMQRLYEQRAISEVAFKGAQTAFEVAEANFLAAKAAVELASPIDGIVTDISVNVGEQAPMGVPLATVASTKKIRLTIFVGADEIRRISVGQTAMVFADSTDPIQAKIIVTSRSADPDTRLFRAELEMNNSGNVLKPGMYGRAQVVINRLDNVLTINNRALFSEEGVNKAYIVENDTVYVREIQIGPTDGDRTQVISGLSEGQKVVISGKATLRDGTPVMIPQEDTENVPG